MSETITGFAPADDPPDAAQSPPAGSPSVRESMHQLLCGVEDAVFVDGYRIEVLEVRGDTVRIGLSTGDATPVVHEIQLPAAVMQRPALRRPSVPSRPALN